MTDKKQGQKPREEPKDQPQENRRLDETVPGGKYLAADGKTFVNANGEPIKG